ncbi:uncharacterized protein LOC142159459 [Mixophyes fleayi]|uniref:uncharacterized protein LOC142159459 n=1 Tax=Mixophyes fleayi TaxID=3061075 RepID=UPI003F4D8CDB
MREVQYLGHHVGGGTHRPEPGKVDAIIVWPTRTMKKQVLSVLGTAGYYRKFVPNYSTLAKLLTDLTKKKLPQVVNWTEESENAFTTLKSALAQSSVLQPPDFKGRFETDCLFQT